MRLTGHVCYTGTIGFGPSQPLLNFPLRHLIPAARLTRSPHDRIIAGLLPPPPTKHRSWVGAVHGVAHDAIASSESREHVLKAAEKVAAANEVINLEADIHDAPVLPSSSISAPVDIPSSSSFDNSRVGLQG